MREHCTSTTKLNRKVESAYSSSSRKSDSSLGHHHIISVFKQCAEAYTGTHGVGRRLSSGLSEEDDDVRMCQHHLLIVIWLNVTQNHQILFTP